MFQNLSIIFAKRKLLKDMLIRVFATEGSDSDQHMNTEIIFKTLIIYVFRKFHHISRVNFLAIFADILELYRGSRKNF